MKVIIVLPAYNAERTLEATWNEIPASFRSHTLLVDDASTDKTVSLARSLGIEVIRHRTNKGYGANQKTCYREALRRGADVVAMLHPDYQYDGTRLPALIDPILRGDADLVLGSRLRHGRGLARQMPWWRYVGNRFLTYCQNTVYSQILSEYHTGFRAFHAHFLRASRFEENADGFLFDQQILAQAIVGRFRIAEIAVGCRYFDDVSSIDLPTALRYGFGSIELLFQYLIHQRRPDCYAYLAPRLPREGGENEEP